ncbi:MAG: dTDP-4-dehydrorhamnose reductase [Rickettsiales bacterium]|nr:dTDP-4-dehydrorhamnose reductase [Rickettsiales bacterium]
MRILLTGCEGQLGSYLASDLSCAGELRAVSRDSLDLTDTPILLRELNTFRPNLIVNAAAYTNVDAAESDAAVAYAVNAVVPAVLAQWAAENAGAIVHFSTDYVFDGTCDTAYLEHDPTCPINEYGRSKLAGEEKIRGAGCAHLIIRTAWLYSARGTNFFRTILRLAAERRTLRVVDDQVGAPTSAAWLSEVVSEIVNLFRNEPRNALKVRGGTINVTCAGTVSWHGFATAIVECARELGFPCAVENIEPIYYAEYPSKTARPANSQLDLRRLSPDWNIDPIDWATALDRVLNEAANNSD